MNRAPITHQGAERLKAELKRLKTVERPKIIEAVAEAREHGDLKENAEYHAAREQQSFNEGRIAELEGIISTAEIIDVANLNVGDKVVFGATVVLEIATLPPALAGHNATLASRAHRVRELWPPVHVEHGPRDKSDLSIVLHYIIMITCYI